MENLFSEDVFTSTIFRFLDARYGLFYIVLQSEPRCLTNRPQKEMQLSV